MSDDAMDLNDEGVARRSIRHGVQGGLTSGELPLPSIHDMIADLDRALHGRTWARPQTPKQVWEELLDEVARLRAVPESDELVRLRALLDEASRSSHQNGQLFTKGAMHPGSWERCEAMSCSDARAALSPDEAAGGE